MTQNVPPIVLYAGIACIVLGFILLFAKNPESFAITNSLSPNSSSSQGNSKTLSIALTNPWTSTGVSIKAGENVEITASGKGVWKNIKNGNPNAYPKPFEECDPNGTPPVDSKDYYSNISSYPTRDAYKGALIGKIGENGTPFKVGSQFNQKIKDTGILYLGINDMKTEVDATSFADNSGSYLVNIKIPNTETEVVYNGSESGVGLGILQKGQTVTVTYVSGKITSNTQTGWSSPIWGIPQSETSPEWLKGLPYKELNTDAVFIDLNGKRTPFQKNQNSVSATAIDNGEARLKMNDSRYWENTGDARFKVTVR